MKSKMPGLGDEIAPGSPMEHRIRDVLTTILKEKRIAAEVQRTDASTFALTGEHAPGSPPPAIVYNILSPSILVDKVIVSGASETVAGSLTDKLVSREGHEYSGGQDWMVRSNVRDELEAKGYLDAQIEIPHDSPRLSDGHYLVNLLVGNGVSAFTVAKQARPQGAGGPSDRSSSLGWQGAMALRD